MGLTTRWIGRAVVACGFTALGCQSAGTRPTPLAFDQTPPTVQAAFADHYAHCPVRDVTRESRGGADYYTVRYATADGSGHDVVYNGAGDEIDRH